MAELQKKFITFHNRIKVDSEELREKRDIILDKIKAYLKKKGHPVPELINQGSYIYGVGIKPIGDLDYDIDVGLAFNIKASEYEAKTVRAWVYDAIKNHTMKVDPRGPCIRVYYSGKDYHVDLVCYAKFDNNDSIEDFKIAYKNNTWKSADPKGLKGFIKNAREKFKITKVNGGPDQLQRITRYLKRWNDVAIPKESETKPFGLAILLLVIDKLQFPVTDINADSEDLRALINVTSAAKSVLGRISIYKPTPEYEDVFGKLTDSAMDKLKQRFSSLFAALCNAQEESDEEKGCKLLQKYFGDDFPDGESQSPSVEDISHNAAKIATMLAAASGFNNPSKPWSADN
ncbi:nucleotidyltransferase [Desulfococcaceae bacterium HSG7]|nr:nucleotidyltransferase [Desulfococcaceae bacterium HSG7]